LLTFFALSFVIAGLALRGQPTPEGKATRILKAHAVISGDESPTPTPEKKQSAPRQKKTSRLDMDKLKRKKTPSKEAEASATPGETPGSSPKAKKSPTKAGSANPKKKKKAVAAKTPSPHKKTRPSETPPVKPAPTIARAIAVPSPSALPPSPTAPQTSTSLYRGPVEEPEQLTIEKYGYEKPRGFWERLFGVRGSSSRSAGYSYLTRSVRDAIDRAPVTRGRWQYIVVHNSGTRQGNAAAFDYYHRHIRRMQNGLAYHFVIGNGTSTGDGQIEIGDRWRRQINGGHVHSDYLNNIALGICLVGDFNRDQPTRAQLECCEELIRYLRQRCGKVGDHWPIVKPHREMNPPRWPTDCPGNVFPYSWFRRFQE
jgi:N-acetylmuramoyl-L-alanine amidase